MVRSEESVEVLDEALSWIWSWVALLSKEMPLLGIGCLDADCCDGSFTCLVNCYNYYFMSILSSDGCIAPSAESVRVHSLSR